MRACVGACRSPQRACKGYTRVHRGLCKGTIRLVMVGNHNLSEFIQNCDSV